MRQSIPLILISMMLLLALVQVLALQAPDAREHEFNESGIYLRFPPGWDASCYGDESAGRLTLAGQNGSISLFWSRDIGVGPDEYLDQAASAYKNGQLSTVANDRSRMDLPGVPGDGAAVLDLTYEFRDHRSRKLFSAWRSESSDRSFLAVLSGLGDNYTWDEAPLELLLETFRDLSLRNASALSQRSTIRDAWGLVLQDLLSSYHYLDPSDLPPRSTHIQVRILLAESGQSYRLSSDENVSIVMPAILAIRPAVVQQLLEGHGYNAKLVQRQGEIWVAVRDPSCKWQPISVNPADPSRSVGVLIKQEDGRLKGIVYDGLDDMESFNSLNLDEGTDPESYVERDCDPSTYAVLSPPDVANATWIRGLSDLLESQSYGRRYEEGVFDCSNVSQICWSILQGSGYDARLMLSHQGHPLGAHMWVAVVYPYEPDTHVAVEAANVGKSGDLIRLGKVVFKPEYYQGIMYNTSIQFSRLQKSEGLWLAPYGPDGPG